MICLEVGRRLHLSPGDLFQQPFPFTSGDEQRFGNAVAVGNFVPTDTTGSVTSDYALTHELAVGTPGGREQDWYTNTTPVYTPGLPENRDVYPYSYEDVDTDQVGTVSVFRGSDTGAVLFETSGSLDTIYVTQLLGEGVTGMTAASDGDEFGSALLTANVQRNKADDLLSGAPAKGDGAFFLTQAAPANDLDEELSGMYEFVDSGDTTRNARVLWFDGAGLTLHVDELDILIQDTEDEDCTLEGFDGSFTTSMNTPAIDIDDSGDPVEFEVEFDEEDVGVEGMTITGEIYYTLATKTFTATFDEPEVDGSDPWTEQDCGIVNSPFDLEWDAHLTCE